MWVLRASLAAQVVDLNERLQTIETQFENEIELTSHLINSNEYKTYLDNFIKIKNTRNFQRDYTIGIRDTFFVRNILDQSSWLNREATLVQLIDDYAIWIESDILSELKLANQIDQFKQVLQTYLLYETDPYSINPNKGIIEILENYVGDFPNSDGDGITDILYLDIIDEFESTGQYVAGFFDPVNLSTHEYSNQRDMVYMDVYPTLIENDSLQSKRSLSTLVHELQHLIHAGYEGTEIEDVFVNEGFSEAVEILCGFDPRNPIPYLSNTSKSLLSWDFSYPISDYSRASLWTQYLIEQFGSKVLKDLIKNEKTGIQGYKESIQKVSGFSFEEVFQNWGIANIVNDRIISEQFGYQHPLLSSINIPLTTTAHHVPAVISGVLPPLSYSVIHVPYIHNLKLEFGENHDKLIKSSGVIHYPNTGFNRVQLVTNQAEQIQSNDFEYGSISVLLSNQSIQADTVLSPINVLIEGNKSASNKTIIYGDGINNTFYSNASFLSLSSIDQKIGLIIPKQSESYWLKSITLSAVFDSELIGNDHITSNERDFNLSIVKINNGKIGEPLLLNNKISSNRESGKLVLEKFSLTEYYSRFSSIDDTLAVIIENDPDDDNFISIGLDFSELKHGIIFNNSSWQPLGEINIGGSSLKGFTPNISIDIVESGHQLVEPPLIKSIQHDFSNVTVDLEIPIESSPSEVHLITKLPDGSFQKFLPTDSNSSGYSFNIPVQVDGTYTFKSVVHSNDGSTTFIDEEQWLIELPNGIKISQNYPNPFNPSTTIPFTILEEASVGWEVFDVLGRTILTIEPKNIKSGEHTLQLDMQANSSGLYFLRAIIGRERSHSSYTKPIKILMIK
ncbi:MAG: T9SS type A sorting domain-containing protein [Balneolaceae bacterium]|nr:T9SS type A sorting domain-containing protein [Balneolaceae bacterium]